MATGGMQPFFWGSGGQRLTPQEVERQRRLADAVLARAGDTSPAASPLAILSRPLQTLGGVFRENRAAEAERLGLEQAQARIDPLIAALTGGQGSGGGMSSPIGYAPSGISPSGYSPTTPISGDGWIEYANQSATRNQPLSPQLVNAMSFLPEMGVTMRVVSGGQDATGPNRVGSTRHDHGNAGDVDFYQNGRKLNWNNQADLPILSNIVSQARANGVTGIGAGDDYMGAGRFHIGFGDEAVWGAGGRSANAPEWLRMAYNSAPQGSGISNSDLLGGTALDAIEQASPTSDPMVMALSAPSPAPVQVAQAGGGNDLLASILAAQADPWAQQQYGGMLNSLLSNELNRINQANDPLRQLQIQQAQANLQNSLNPWQARPATAEELAPWGITPQQGESWTIGQDGLPQQVFGPTSMEADFINVETPNGIMTFNMADPNQAAQVNELFASGLGRQVGLGAGDTAAQDRIARLTENLQSTGTILDPEQARAVATAIADNRYRESRHPTTGEVVIVDMATGKQVNQGGMFNPEGVEIPGMQQPAPPPPVDSQYGDAFPAANQSFGLEGAARGLANTVSGIFGGTFDPAVQQTQADFGVLRESLLNDIASSYGRQPPSWLLQEIRSLTPEAGSPLVGAEQAVSKLNALGRHFENEKRVQQGILQNTQLTPQTRQEIELRISGLDAGLARVNSALQSFGRQAQEGEAAPQASEDGWIDLGNGIRMREVQ